MQLSEQDEKRWRELTNQFDTICNKIQSLVSPHLNEEKIIFSLEQLKKYGELFDQQSDITTEIRSILNMEGINHD
jgi:hypothetical protein